MLNQTGLVGRLVKDPEVKKLENGKSVSTITIAVPRNYKNENGEYDTDFINCILWSNVAESTSEYCKKGDMLGIKGRIQTESYETDGKINYSTKVIAERVTFLSSSKINEKEEEMEV